MRVLVTAASKHGSTDDIADRIADRLRLVVDVDRRTPAEVASVDRYDAIVIGSAVYAGHWLPAARDLVTAVTDRLAGRPVFLFSSGPVGDPLKPADDSVDVRAILSATGARDHRVFAGRIDRGRLGFAEKAIVAALRVPDGDYRDWAAIDAWATSIVAVLGAGPPK